MSFDGKPGVCLGSLEEQNACQETLWGPIVLGEMPVPPHRRVLTFICTYIYLNIISLINTTHIPIDNVILLLYYSLFCRIIWNFVDGAVNIG